MLWTISRVDEEMKTYEHTLLFHVRVVPQISTNDFRSHSKVEADATALQGSNHDFHLSIILKVVDRLVPSIVRHLAVILFGAC